MGVEKTYRWDRRHRRNTRQNIRDAKRVFWGFEVILLILIFSIWAIGAKFVLMFAIVTSSCAEAIAAFGQSYSNLSTFDLLFWISVLMAAFWVVISFVFWKFLRRPIIILFHLSLFFSIFLLMASFKLVHIDNNIPPDGTLAVGQTVRDMSSGEPRYAPLDWNGNQFGKWYLGKTNITDDIWYHRNTQRCVWLDRNIIMDAEYIDIDGYIDAPIEDKREMYNGQLKSYEPWKSLTTFEQVKLLYSGVFEDAPSMQSLRSRQQYRPLFDEERARFIEKQRCFEENASEPKRYSICEYYWGEDMDGAYMSWLETQ